MPVRPDLSTLNAVQQKGPIFRGRVAGRRHIKSGQPGRTGGSPPLTIEASASVADVSPPALEPRHFRSIPVSDSASSPVRRLRRDSDFDGGICSGLKTDLEYALHTTLILWIFSIRRTRNSTLGSNPWQRHGMTSCHWRGKQASCASCAIPELQHFLKRQPLAAIS